MLNVLKTILDAWMKMGVIMIQMLCALVNVVGIAMVAMTKQPVIIMLMQMLIYLKRYVCIQIWVVGADFLLLNLDIIALVIV